MIFEIESLSVAERIVGLLCNSFSLSTRGLWKLISEKEKFLRIRRARVALDYMETTIQLSEQEKLLLLEKEGLAE